MYLSIYDTNISKIICFLKNPSKEYLHKYAKEKYSTSNYLYMYVEDKSVCGEYRKLIKEV